MADFGSPVVNTTYDPTAGIRTISGLLGVQQQQAGVQTARAQAQAAQQQMAERAAFTNMLKTGVDDQGNPIRTPDGDVDPAKVVAAQGRIAPIYGSEWSSGIIKAHADKVGLQSALQSLDANGRALIAGPMQAFGLNPSDANLATTRDTIAGLVQDHPELGATAKHAGAMLDQIGSVPDTPQNAGQRSMMASRFSAQFQTKQPVATQWTGQDIDTGPNVQSGVKAPPAAGGGFTPATTTGKAVPPGVSILTDPRTGNMYAINPQDPGKTMLVGQGGKLFTGSTATTPAGGAPNAPAAAAPAPGGAPAPAAARSATGAAPTTLPTGTMDQNRPPVYTPGEANLVEANAKTIAANRTAAQDSLTNLDILGRIKQLSQSGVYTGPHSQGVADLATELSRIPGFEGAAQYANNYNELVKFMSQNAARQGAALGLGGSDARIDLAKHALGSGDMDPRTIGDIADYMTGITRMSAAKANAQDTWLGQPGNSSKNSDIFERMWRSNADPRLFQIAEMRDAGAQQDYAKLHIRKSEVADLTKKHEWLVHVGALPPDQQQVAPASAGGAGAPAPTGGATGQW